MQGSCIMSSQQSGPCSKQCLLQLQRQNLVNYTLNFLWLCYNATSLVWTTFSPIFSTFSRLTEDQAFLILKGSVWTSIGNLQDTSHLFFCSHYLWNSSPRSLMSLCSDFRSNKVRPSLYAEKALLHHVELKGRTICSVLYFDITYWHWVANFFYM